MVPVSLMRLWKRSRAHTQEKDGTEPIVSKEKQPPPPLRPGQEIQCSGGRGRQHSHLKLGVLSSVRGQERRSGKVLASFWEYHCGTWLVKCYEIMSPYYYHGLGSEEILLFFLTHVIFQIKQSQIGRVFCDMEVNARSDGKRSWNAQQRAGVAVSILLPSNSTSLSKSLNLCGPSLLVSKARDLRKTALVLLLALRVLWCFVT